MIIAVTHQPALFECADMVYRLENGRVHDVTLAPASLHAIGMKTG